MFDMARHLNVFWFIGNWNFAGMGSMHPELLKRLKEVDGRGDWESPADFNYFCALGEVVHHKKYIEEFLGVRLTLDDQIQDAAFFCDLFKKNDDYSLDENNGGAGAPFLVIRFSSFDRMFTIFGTGTVKLRDRLQLVIHYLVNHDYRYLAEADLSEPYDNPSKPDRSELTWFTRFVSYL